MRIDTSEPSLTALFEKGQVGLIRTEFMRKDDVIDSLVSENARLKAEVDALKLGSLLTAVDVLQFIKLKAEVERLKAQRTKLIESAEELFRFIGQELYGPIDHFEADWEAAKEGEQSV